MDDERARVELSPEQIPEVGPLALLRLGDPVIAPPELLQEMIRDVAADAVLGPYGKSGLRAAYDGGRLIAFVDPRTGESRIFPLLESGLEPVNGLAGQARAVAERFASRKALFPTDDTRLVARTPTVLLGSRRHRDGQRGQPAEYLGYVRLRRHVGDVPVFGPGTRATLAVAGDGTVRGFTHRWRPATMTGARIEPHSRPVIADAIVRQIVEGGSTRHSDVRVDKVTLAYYDGAADLMQPTYRFQATVSSRRRDLLAADRRIVGFVSVGEPPEPLPTFGVRRGRPPIDPPDDLQEHAVAPGDPTVGRYVVRNDTDEWVTSANEFLGGLQTAQGLFGSPIAFTDSQYYWAEPRLFLGEKDSFVNAVNIALTEVHGNWGLFSTRDNQDDLVYLSNIPASGYGGGDSGSLAYWILHSCEVIPTQTDETTSFDVWWNIFNGLHAAVGYRTEMWIDDDVTGSFGLAIGLGAPVVSAWLNDVATDDAYDDGDTYYDGNRKTQEPMGRASAVAVCGHSDDPASDVSNLGPASCLTEWWFDN
jgi:hypothetical protein